MTKDWSFTSWGESGPVSVEIIGKRKDHWPLVKRDDSRLPRDEIELSSRERKVERLCSNPGFVYKPAHEPNQCDLLKS